MFQHVEELYKKFLRHEIKNEKDLIKHFVVNEIYPSIPCSRCSRRLDARVKNIKIKYRCNFCQKEVVNPAVFSEIKTKLMLHQQIQLLVYFVQNLSLKQIKCFTGISMPTIIGFFKVW